MRLANIRGLGNYVIIEPGDTSEEVIQYATSKGASMRGDRLPVFIVQFPGKVEPDMYTQSEIESALT